jgi:hypothetical protein
VGANRDQTKEALRDFVIERLFNESTDLSSFTVVGDITLAKGDEADEFTFSTNIFVPGERVSAAIYILNQCVLSCSCF